MNMLITIRSREWIDEEEDCTELTVTGEYIRDGGVHVITYREQADAQAGYGCTTTTLRVCADTVLVIRDGGMHCELPLQRHKRHMCRYTTPYGELPLSVYTHSLSVSLFEQYGGQISVRYTLELSGAGATEHELQIRLSPQP